MGLFDRDKNGKLLPKPKPLLTEKWGMSLRQKQTMFATGKFSVPDNHPLAGSHPGEPKDEK